MASLLASLNADERQKLLGQLSDEDCLRLQYDWRFWARPAQTAPPGDWLIWLVLAGRGFGKTRTGAEWVREKVESGKAGRIALVAPTAADSRDVMVEDIAQGGGSGILAISPPWSRPLYEPSKRRLTWPNGATATTYSADEPDRLRGPQHDLAWADESASWHYIETWDMLMFGLRLGDNPQCCVTTTPKPVQLIRDLKARVGKDVVLTMGNTYDNAVNLAPSFLSVILNKYQGTRLGRQEIYAELLDDNPEALWKRVQIDEDRKTEYPRLTRIVVALDPEAESSEGSAETGIVVAGLGVDGHGYLLEDATLRGTPREWASQGVACYHKHRADRLVAEKNNGGEMVEHTVKTVDPNIAYKEVHASRSKQARAEPISALCEQHRIHHVGSFPLLEDQLCTWEPNTGLPSPDRLDAYVWAFTELMIGHVVPPVVAPVSMTRANPWKIR